MFNFQIHNAERKRSVVYRICVFLWYIPPRLSLKHLPISLVDFKKPAIWYLSEFAYNDKIISLEFHSMYVDHNHPSPSLPAPLPSLLPMSSQTLSHFPIPHPLCFHF